MLSLFKKITNTFQSEARILENFIQEHLEHILESEAELHHIPHARNEESDPIPTLVYKITKQEVEILRQELWDVCDRVIHEDGLWYMGIMNFSGRRVGFYLGMSYELEHEWARFWLEPGLS